jgi:transcriptional regulator with XRE-family HTH domain
VAGRSARLREQIGLAGSLRAEGRTWSEIAAALRDRYGLNARVAMRVAHGWTQAEVAHEWSLRWPDDPKTFKNISYWENWPSPTGHMPSLTVLDRLAQVYGCTVADLVAGWGEHGDGQPTNGSAEPETLAWQVGHLDLHQLTRAVADWARRLPDDQRRALLLKLSTAAAVAAGRSSSAPTSALGRGPALTELDGPWESRYTYVSTGRGAELEGAHRVVLRAVGGRLVGRSEPTDSGTLELELATDGLLVTGRWTEHTAPDGYYRGAVYHGILQLVLDPTGRSMAGRWLGPDRHFEIACGPWQLQRTS